MCGSCPITGRRAVASVRATASRARRISSSVYGTVGTFRHSGARRRLKPTLNKVRQMFDLFLQPDDLDTRLTGGGDLAGERAFQRAQP